MFTEVLGKKTGAYIIGDVLICNCSIDMFFFFSHRCSLSILSCSLSVSHVLLQNWQLPVLEDKDQIYT